jgi:hypothetical protein
MTAPGQILQADDKYKILADIPGVLHVAVYPAVHLTPCHCDTAKHMGTLTP